MSTNYSTSPFVNFYYTTGLSEIEVNNFDCFVSDSLNTTIIKSKIINNVLCYRNQVTELSGNFFSDSNVNVTPSFTMTLNPNWKTDTLNINKLLINERVILFYLSIAGSKDSYDKKQSFWIKLYPKKVLVAFFHEKLFPFEFSKIYPLIFFLLHRQV